MKDLKRFGLLCVTKVGGIRAMRLQELQQQLLHNNDTNNINRNNNRLLSSMAKNYSLPDKNNVINYSGLLAWSLSSGLSHNSRLGRVLAPAIVLPNDDPKDKSIKKIRPNVNNNPYTLTNDALLLKSAKQNRSLEAALALPEPAKLPHIAILVQTNFHLCAYTTSELHVKMLSLFCYLPEYLRLHNYIIARLTRDSVKVAFVLGITAAQILRFYK